MDGDDLTPDNIYNTKEYGLVQFLKIVPDRNTVSGICYKFETADGDSLYIRPSELNMFIRE